MDTPLWRSQQVSRLGLTALLLTFAAQSLFGQASTATVLGVIRDMSGAVVPGVSVKIVGEQTGFTRKTESDGSGNYQVPLIPIGTYSLTAEREGFRTLSQTGIVLAQDQKATIDLVLEPGALTQTVTVQGVAPMVNASTTESGGTLTRDKIEALPLLGRNWAGLVMLQPGVTATKAGGAWHGFSLNGGNYYGMNLTMDGTDMSNVTTPTAGGFAPFYSPLVNTVGLDDIAEIKTTKGVYTAETGRSISGGLNIITKSGTNQLHGSLFEFFQNNALNARNFFAAGVPANKINQFGGNVGGPILRNKLFFFAGYEGARLRQQSVQQTLVPTQAFRSSLPAVLQPVWNDVPLPNIPNPPTLTDPNLGYFQLLAPPTDREDHGMIRLDYQVSDRQNAFLRYNLNNAYNTTIRSGLPKNLYQVMNVSQVATLGDTFSISPRSVNEFRIGVNRLKWRAITSGGTAGDLDVTVCVTSFACNGAGGGKGTRSAEESYTIADNFSHQASRHFLKMGFEGRRPRDNRIDHDPKYAIVYNTVADFRANDIYQTKISFGNDGAGFRNVNLGFYFQDNFKVSPELTLNLGLRYEKNTVFKELHGRLYNVVDSPFGPFRSPGEPVYNADNNNWEPRAGFAYSPSWARKLVIRSGFGVYVIPMTPINMWYYASNPTTPVAVTVDGASLGGFQLSYPLPGNLDALGLRPQFGGISALDPNIRDPYSMQWSFDVQRELTANTSITAGYYGNRGVKYYEQMILNTIDPVTRVRPNPAFGNITWGDGGAHSTYHGLQVQLSRRLGGGLMYDFNYTYSKTMTYGQNESLGGGSRLQNYNNIRADRSVSVQDRAHVATFDFQYELPIGQGRRVLSRSSGIVRVLSGGWALSGLGSFVSGAPLNVTATNVAGTGVGTTRPNVVGGAEPYTGITGPNLRFLNPAAFSLPASGQFGNAGRNSLRGPGGWNSDLALLKNTRLAERFTLQFRVEAFSWLNHPMWGNPNVNWSSSSYGLITSASGNRRLQLGLKLLW